ncbi:hypothetical protein [Lichenifustis flavocetrariae]|uniref:Uncharacterized protein n=1 Tax=Lichenifustis flavocetrariae TaxID=2949735 RepID=A0AA41Z5U8_9HYPH|nr:hypothetical protein [Lichenifustis flavocetrariae]MCW6510885.1 hypothetical protein [Lichenifustis flavocetrariae]
MKQLPQLVAALVLSATIPALAEDPPSTQSLKAPGDCTRTEAATRPAPAAADGTAPGNAGSTGWSGGTGGSYVGTVPAGAAPDSKTFQPATARGLDPISSPPKMAQRDCPNGNIPSPSQSQGKS